jgi:hypothetical protein
MLSKERTIFEMYWKNWLGWLIKGFFIRYKNDNFLAEEEAKCRFYQDNTAKMLSKA